MNFRDLQYSIGKLKSDVQTQIAKNNPMQNQDTKSLSLWIFEERNDLASMRTLGYQRSETNKAFKNWIAEDMTAENTKDLQDIVGDKLIRLLDKQVEIEQEYTRKYQQYRQAIKSIREREDKMSDVREKKRSLQSRINNLAKSSAQSPKLLEFRKELKSLEHDTVESEVDLANFKRFALKEAFYVRMNAMQAFAEKTALLSGYGKYLIDLIDLNPKEYESGPQAAIILADAFNALDYYKPAQEDERSTFAAVDIKGKAPSVPKHSQPPKLPPRNNTVHVEPQQEPQEPQETQETQATGDHKTHNESEIDLERIDLYDAPPPAYAPPEAPLNADRPGSVYSNYQSHAVPQGSHGGPYQEHHQPYPPPHDAPYPGYHESPQPGYQNSPYPAYQNSPYPAYQNSPYPAYQNSPYNTHDQVYHASPRPGHAQTSSNPSVRPSSSMISEYGYPVDYHQLYRQVSQRQNTQQQEYRPYEEFQQKFGVDAGGFRVPPPMTAEEEKEELAKRYSQQDSNKTYEENKPNYKE